MRKALSFIGKRGVDLLTGVCVIIAGYLLMQPGSQLRVAFERYRLTAATKAATARKWSEIVAISSPLTGEASSAQVVEVSDYQCPYCRKSAAAVDSAVKAGLHVAYLNYPLPMHPQAEGAAIAAICAESEGRFHEMHARLMSSSAWQQDSNWMREATAAGVSNLRKFGECLRGSAVHIRLAQERALADSLGVTGTPLFVSRTAMHQGVASTTELFALGRRR